MEFPLYTDKPNVNGHTYPKAVVLDALERYFNSDRPKLGEFIHKPVDPNKEHTIVDIGNLAVVLEKYGDTAEGLKVECSIMTTPAGKKLTKLLKAGPMKMGLRCMVENKDFENGTIKHIKEIISIDVMEDENAN